MGERGEELVDCSERVRMLIAYTDMCVIAESGAAVYDLSIDLKQWRREYSVSVCVCVCVCVSGYVCGSNI